jgi:protein-S-isoprenylcysteine O-methyltransferase Ste14
MPKSKIIRIAILRFIFIIILMLTVLFLSAGRLDWWEGWAYAGLALVVLIISRVVMLINDPDMIIERMAAGQEENVKPWDKILVPVISLYLPLVTWIVAGLDARFGWSPDLPDSIQIAALLGNFAASMFSTWATFANRFFSSHVRIQADRGHTVVREGPYQFMRHPGYTGAVVCWLSTPIFFSSTWAWIPAILAIIGFVIRTSLEDRTLQEELPGYIEYTQEVRYRLLPGIW